jgi:hypothetical protein
MIKKSITEIFYEMFSDPQNQRVSLILVLTALAFFYASFMEAYEFYYTHVFHLDEYLKEVMVLLTPIMTIYSGEKLGHRYIDRNKPDNADTSKQEE